MRRPGSLLAAGFVLSIGIGSALFFRHPSGTEPGGSLLRESELVRRRGQSADSLPWDHLPADSLAPGSANAALPSLLALGGPTAGRPKSTPEGTPWLTNTAADEPQAAADRSHLPFAAQDPPPPAIARHYPHGGPLDDSPRAAAPSTTHRVADGDSLASLAQRYLGDASHAADLFLANRQVLSDPELLPIGALLTIPARQTPQTAGGQAIQLSGQREGY